MSKDFFFFCTGSFCENPKSGSGSSKPKSVGSQALSVRENKEGGHEHDESFSPPSADPSSLSLSSCRTSSSSLDTPDIKSSSVSIRLAVVSGVGGAAAAEAILLL